MKRYTLILLSAAFTVTQAQAMRQQEGSQSSWSTAKVLGALGLAAGAGAFAYHKYDPAAAQQKFDDAKKMFGEYKDSAVTYVKNADNKTLALGAAGTAFATYLAYRAFFASDEPELAVETPNSDAFLRNLGKKTATKTTPQTERASEFHGWLKEAGTLLWQVFGHIKDEGKRRAAIKPYIEVVAQDPHQLLRDESFMQKLTAQQKLALLQIFGAYTVDRTIKAAQVLYQSFGTDQKGVKEMLGEVLDATDPRQTVVPLLEIIDALVSDKHITGKQAEFVEGELAFIKDCANIQTNFSEIYGLDALLAQRMQHTK